MSFVSYAQNFEDVLLRRALHDVSHGRYLDIGAQDPIVDSVSFAFYLAGWRGIHVEATPTYAARLREARPDEIVIEAAVTDAAGPIEFYEIPDTGLSTGEPDIARMHAEGGLPTRKIVVPCIRLDNLLDSADVEPHWMKVDVEGMEAEVLRSWGESQVRPWVLVVESTFPNSQRPTHSAWERELHDRGYREAFYDGLSRYFVHEAHAELGRRFDAPVNVFDGFSVARHHFSAAHLRGGLQLLEERVDTQTAEITRLHQEVSSTTERLLKEQQQREISLRHAHEVELAETCGRERRLAEREFRKKEMWLRHALGEAESRDASTRIELARLEERSSQLEQRLADADKALIRADDQITEAGQKIASLEGLLDRTRARAEQQIDEHRAISARADALIRAVLAERPSRWQRIGETLGLTRRGAAWRSLERWSPTDAGAELTSGEHTKEILQTMQTQRPTRAQEVPAGATSLAELLSADGEDFVRLAYLTVLGRRADPEGESYYVDRIRNGRSKIEVLDQLRNSDEGKQCEQLPELEEALRQFRSSRVLSGKRTAGAAIQRRILEESSVIRVDHFMRYHDEQFLAQVFAYYLGRQPDPAGFAHYLRLIRSGTSRQHVLLDIARSPEARKRGKRAVGEGRIAAALIVDHIPIVRTLVAIIRFNLNLRRHMREMRALQNHLYRLSKNLP